MKARRVGILIAFVVGLPIMDLSCIRPCGGGGGGPDRFRVNDIDITLVKKVTTGGSTYFHWDSIATDSSAFNRLGFLLRPDVEYISAIMKGSITPAAFACEPAEPQVAEKIAFIAITSAEAFQDGNMIYEPGADLSELFEAEYYETMTLQQVFDGWRLPDRRGFVIMLAVDPVEKKSYAFNFHVTLEDGTTFDAASEAIVIL